MAHNEEKKIMAPLPVKDRNTIIAIMDDLEDHLDDGTMEEWQIVRALRRMAKLFKVERAWRDLPKIPGED